MVNSMGPKTLPCGISLVTGLTCTKHPINKFSFLTRTQIPISPIRLLSEAMCYPEHVPMVLHCLSFL